MVLKYKNNSINKISSRKFTSPGEHYLAKSTFSTIMPNTHHHSYDLNFKLKIVAEGEAVNNNRDIVREYGISESKVWKWRNQQDISFSGELKMTAKRAFVGRYQPKDSRQYTTQMVLFRTTIFIKVNYQHCVSFYLLEIVPVTVIKKNCFGKIFAYKMHPNFGVIFSRN